MQPQECDATPTRPCSKCCSDEQLSDSKQEQVVDSQDAHARLEAALHSLGHSGTTLCSTASNARPTVLDYHYAYEHGERLYHRGLHSMLNLPNAVDG